METGMGLRAILREKIGSSRARDPLLASREGVEMVASIMVVAALSDGGVSAEENLRMVQLLRSRFGLSSVDALALVRDIPERVQTEADVERLIAALKKDLSMRGRQELMMMVLEIIAVDREKEAGEMTLLSRLVDALEVSEESMSEVYRRYFETRRSSRP
jgi:uncharacterized tellurite resistance protein B-like protein